MKTKRHTGLEIRWGTVDTEDHTAEEISQEEGLTHQHKEAGEQSDSERSEESLDVFFTNRERELFAKRSIIIDRGATKTVIGEQTLEELTVTLNQDQNFRTDSEGRCDQTKKRCQTRDEIQIW